MKRRAILELVCNLRKNRDFWRKMWQESEDACNEMQKQADKYFDMQQYDVAREWSAKRAGAYSVMQYRAGQADAFHRSAHNTMWLLER